MVCGAPLVYFETNQRQTCHFCNRNIAANACCSEGHFVCDDCHRDDAALIIESICLHSDIDDPALLMQTIRSHQGMRIHGPEHHILVPAVILAALRNNGHPITDNQLITAIERGRTICGGACAFFGACGAATGVGIAVSLVLDANPVDAVKRTLVLGAVQSVLARIASFEAARCCQRDAWLAFTEAAPILEGLIGVTFPVTRLRCAQFAVNKECIRNHCPLWPDPAWTGLV